MSGEQELALQAKAWPFEEARKLIARYKGKAPAKGYVLFETGYGPSGLPHIGTFGEVARTTMVRRAFQIMAPDVPTKLFAFSDDMDGLRKVPDNIPNQEMVREHLGKPLTKVPDPFGKFESFGHHNNAMLRGFLDNFGFEYEFQSATDWYGSRRVDEAVLGGLGAVRGGLAAGAAELRPRHEGEAAVAPRGAARPLQPLPADLAGVGPC